MTTLKPLLDTLTIRYVHCIKKGNIALCSMEMSLSEEIRRVTRLISGLPTPIVHYTGINTEIITEGNEFLEYEYTATKKCELYITFKMPLGNSLAEIRLNGNILGCVGYAWLPSNESMYLFPCSFALSKGDTFHFLNTMQPSPGIQVQKVSIYILVVRY